MDKREEVDLIGRCKCCLDDTNLQCMWEEQCIDGEREIYGSMAVECFALNWQSVNNEDLICNSCVNRLREAVNFKREIIASEQVLLEGLLCDVKDDQCNVIKDEIVEVKVEDFNDFEVEFLDIENTDKVDENSLVAEETNQISENFEYSLESTSDNADQLDQAEPDQIDSQTKRIWPRKRRGKDRVRLYKQYTKLELQQALKSIVDGKLSRSQASDAYGIPLRTLCTKINSIPDGQMGSVHEEDTKTKNMKFIEEIRLILSHTNAIPFKTKTAKYHCAYCSTEGPLFETGVELRAHTINQHARERIRQVEIFMRPYWINEVLKLDIFNLTCTICNTELLEWNDMFQHFADAHDIGFDEAYTRVIPYQLTDQIKCALCHDSFQTFHILDGHMNAHYNNYICYECGDTFLAAARLDKHVQVHNKGRFPCEVCGKVFTLENYRVKHYNYIHNTEKNVKCFYCPEKFSSLSQRQKHIVAKHNEKAKTYACEFCGKVYYQKQSFRRHLQRRHIREKKFSCSLCDMGFIMKYELDSHMVKHTKEKRFFCSLCDEGFTRKTMLNSHFKRHGKKE